uniref:response regulator n=1 Tax=Stenotrophomonas maltophilia TaxID=40324 RepID=UPI0013DB8780
VLDRQLPDGDGLSLIPKLRASGNLVPVLVLTARGELNDRVAGLDKGADDYLAKPFAFEELLARLRALLR